MEMQKDSAKSAWLFLVKPLLRSILTERSARQDIPVPATRERKSSEMVTFFVLQFSRTYIYLEIKIEFNLYLLGSISPFLGTNFLTINMFRISCNFE